MQKLGQMSVYDERREDLEKFEFMMGRDRGRLAVTLDCITDALVLVGQHGVYCQSVRQLGKPAMDIQLIVKSLTDAKELITSVIELNAGKQQMAEQETQLEVLQKRIVGLLFADGRLWTVSRNHNSVFGEIQKLRFDRRKYLA